MKKLLIIIVFLACLLAGLFSAWKLYGYYRIYHDGKKEKSQGKRVKRNRPPCAGEDGMLA